MGKLTIRELPLAFSRSGLEDSTNASADWNVEGGTVTRTDCSERNKDELEILPTKWCFMAGHPL